MSNLGACDRSQTKSKRFEILSELMLVEDRIYDTCIVLKSSIRRNTLSYISILLMNFNFSSKIKGALKRPLTP